MSRSESLRRDKTKTCTKTGLILSAPASKAYRWGCVHAFALFLFALPLKDHYTALHSPHTTPAFIAQPVQDLRPDQMARSTSRGISPRPRWKKAPLCKHIYTDADWIHVTIETHGNTLLLIFNIAKMTYLCKTMFCIQSENYFIVPWSSTICLQFRIVWLNIFIFLL